MEITPKMILESCKANSGYTTPSLNDQLFLQCKGIGKISNLERYTNLRALWLDSNAIREIEGLDHNTQLSALYLNNNFISKISGLDSLSMLHTLNLSHNVITFLSGLRQLMNLETLHMTHNRIESLSALEELWFCPKLTCVDLAHNPLRRQPEEPDDAVVLHFERMPQLSVLYLTGTEISRTMRFYRKNMISRIPSLQYLDERPVFPEERRAVTAWAQGGDEAERAERNAIAQEKRDQLTNDVLRLKDLAQKMQPKKEARTKEWEAIQELQDGFWRTKTEARRDMKIEEEACRSGIDAHEAASWASFLETFESRKSAIIEEQEEKKRRHEERQEALKALRTPLQESRAELLKQLNLWKEDDYFLSYEQILEQKMSVTTSDPSLPHQPENSEEEEEEEEEWNESSAFERLKVNFENELHALLYPGDIPMKSGSGEGNNKIRDGLEGKKTRETVVRYFGNDHQASINQAPDVPQFTKFSNHQVHSNGCMHNTQCILTSSPRCQVHSTGPEVSSESGRISDDYMHSLSLQEMLHYEEDLRFTWRNRTHRIAKPQTVQIWKQYQSIYSK